MDQYQRLNYIIDLLLDLDKLAEESDNEDAIDNILHELQNQIMSSVTNDTLEDEVKHILLETISKYYAHDSLYYGLIAANLCGYL